MAVCQNTRVIIIFLITIVILESDTKRTHLREGELPEKRDYRPSKWVANSAMDVWYGNKSMIDVISREFADIMYKLTARPVRSPYSFDLRKPFRFPAHRIIEQKKVKPVEEPRRVSRVDINFINTNNETFHTIMLQPMQPSTQRPWYPLKTAMF